MLIGAGLSYLLAYLVNDSEVVAAVVWAPVTEEFGKGLFLILLVVLRPRQLHGPLDGAIYAALVGIGFSFVEDTLYYSVELSSAAAPESLAVLVVLRGVLGAFSHSLYAAMFGIGIGIAVQTRSSVVRVLAPLVGFVAAVALHALWNASVTFYDQLGFLVAYVLRHAARARSPDRGLGVWARQPGGGDDPRVAGRVRPVRFRVPRRDRAGREPARAAVRPAGHARRIGGRAAEQADEGLPADPDRDGLPARPGATRAGPPGRGRPDGRPQRSGRGAAALRRRPAGRVGAAISAR